MWKCRQPHASATLTPPRNNAAGTVMSMNNSNDAIGKRTRDMNQMRECVPRLLCVCVCVCVYIYIYIYVCVCVCVSPGLTLNKTGNMRTT